MGGITEGVGVCLGVEVFVMVGKGVFVEVVLGVYDAVGEDVCVVIRVGIGVVAGEHEENIRLKSIIKYDRCFKMITPHINIWFCIIVEELYITQFYVE